MLEHPHIVSIYEIGTQPGRQYFSRQLIEGGSLAVAMRRGEWLVNSKESEKHFRILPGVKVIRPY